MTTTSSEWARSEPLKNDWKMHEAGMVRAGTRLLASTQEGAVHVAKTFARLLCQSF